MSNAAHLRKLYVKATSVAPSAGDELDGAINFSFSSSRTVLDTTNYKGPDTKTKMLGLKDGSGTIDGDWLPADTIQALLTAAFANGTTVYVTDLPDGTNGWTYPVLVEKVDSGGAVDDKVPGTFGITQNGAAIVRP